ncbi:Imm50 family immunity protein [Paenibacillus algorifonticola]|uniref:Imm50 family immunity protein n=1 Tax=Paenibacillus algorifonticola TaxID=684063 RepID=UPI003D2A0914
MNRAAEWSIRVLSVEPERLHFPHARQDTLGYRLKLKHSPKIELLCYDHIQVATGTAGTSSWAAFTAIVMEINPESMLLFTAPMYQEQLKEAHKIKRIFSPLHSIQGAEQFIAYYGYFPPFHYDEIIDVGWEAENEGSSEEKSLTIAIKPSLVEEAAKNIIFRFQGVHEENLSSVEDPNTIFQLEFTYQEEAIRVVIDSQEGFGGQFLCRSVHVGWEC